MSVSTKCEESVVEENASTSTREGSPSKPLAHMDLVVFFQESIKQLVNMDPILKDLHPQVTVDEVEALLALEKGNAMTLYVEHGSGTNWKLVVSRDATLHQLKLALKHHVNLTLLRRNQPKSISWKYIWRTYWLCFEGTRLVDDNKKLLSFGISHKAKLSFLKKINKKE